MAAVKSGETFYGGNTIVSHGNKTAIWFRTHKLAEFGSGLTIYPIAYKYMPLAVCGRLNAFFTGIGYTHVKAQICPTKTRLKITYDN